MIEFKEYVILPVDVSAALPKGSVLGEKHGKFVKAVMNASENFSGDGTTTSFNLANKPVVYGSVAVTVDGVATSVDVDYENGVITFATAPAAGAAIVVDYKYYAAEPSAILVEDVAANQIPATAKLLVFGEFYADELAEAIEEEVKHKLMKNGVFVKDRVQV